jgi:hypothetical protein
MRCNLICVSIAAIAGTLWGTPARAGQLRPETLSAWQAYVRTAESGHHAGAGQGKFLWTDEVPERCREVRAGAVAVSPVGGGLRQIPKGLVHDWVGSVFIPGVTLEQVLHAVQDYDGYRAMYSPSVVESHTVRRRAGQDVYTMRLMRRVLVVTAVFDTEHEAHYRRLDQSRLQSLDYTTAIQEVERFGKPDERQLPPDMGNGYLWRMFSITRYEARDNGVYVEIEAVALTRDVPAYLRWLVNPIVSRLPRELLRTTLEQTRAAVVERSKAGETPELPTMDRHLSRQVPIVGSAAEPGRSLERRREVRESGLAAGVWAGWTPSIWQRSGDRGAVEAVSLAPDWRMVASSSRPAESMAESPESSMSSSLPVRTEVAVCQACSSSGTWAAVSSPARTNRKVVGPS